MSEGTSEPTPVLPLSYDAQPRRRENVLGVISLALALICASLPLHMLWQLLSGQTRKFVVYKPYAAKLGGINLGVNWPWFALDTLALLLGIVGLYLGGRRLSIGGIVLAAVSMIGVMTLVLGSPW